MPTAGARADGWRGGGGFTCTNRYNSVRTPTHAVHVGKRDRFNHFKRGLLLRYSDASTGSALAPDGEVGLGWEGWIPYIG